MGTDPDGKVATSTSAPKETVPVTPETQSLEKPIEIAVPLPRPILNALEKVPDEAAKAVLSVALSRTSVGFGPDPETAKTLAQTEMHEEDCKLKAFQCSLQNREEQSKRDHEFRKKKLNHQTSLTVVVMIVTIGGVAGGLVLSSTGNPSLGNPILAASFVVLATLAGKLLASRDKD
jgi:hypothetical protein